MRSYVNSLNKILEDLNRIPPLSKNSYTSFNPNSKFSCNLGLSNSLELLIYCQERIKQIEGQQQ